MKKKRIKSIGVFDSGVGGLTILKSVMKRLPQYTYVYLGDTAHAPYGDRSQKEVLQFAKEAIDFLFSKNCELVLFACNTVSAEALRSIQTTYLHKRYGKEKRVLGVIVPTLEVVAENQKHTRVGIIATRATVNSGRFLTELKKIAPKIKIFQQAAPLLVPMIERGEQGSVEMKKVLRQYLEPLMKKKIDTLVLGCTHYGHIEREIKRIVGKRVKVISEGPIIAKKLADYLKRHAEMERTLSKKKKVRFYTTGKTAHFKKHSTLFFGKPVSAVRAKL